MFTAFFNGPNSACFFWWQHPHCPLHPTVSPCKLLPQLPDRIIRAHCLFQTRSTGSEMAREPNRTKETQDDLSRVHRVSCKGESILTPQGWEPGTAKTHHIEPKNEANTIIGKAKN